MAATPARIGFITQQYRVAVAGPDDDVVAKYGKAARDTTDPLPTFFDSADDAQAMADERLALLSADRRRYSLTTLGDAALPANLPITPAVPTVHVNDTEHGADFDAVAVELGMDLEAGTSTIVAWG